MAKTDAHHANRFQKGEAQQWNFEEVLACLKNILKISFRTLFSLKKWVNRLNDSNALLWQLILAVILRYS